MQVYKRGIEHPTIKTQFNPQLQRRGRLEISQAIPETIYKYVFISHFPTNSIRVWNHDSNFESKPTLKVRQEAQQSAAGHTLHPREQQSASQ
jgi:hypothetical protein